MTDMKKIIIDNQELEVDSAMTLLQACEVASIEVPRFCYHERLSIAGNCRIEDSSVIVPLSEITQNEDF